MSKDFNLETATHLPNRANKIVGRLPKGSTPAGDLLLIIAVVSLIVNIVRMWNECDFKIWSSPQDAARKAGPIFQERVRRIAYRELLKQNMDVNLAPELTKAALAELGSMNDNEIRQVVSEIK